MKYINIKKILTVLIILIGIFVSITSIFPFARITEVIDSTVLLIIYIIFIFFTFVLLLFKLIPSQLETGLLVFILIMVSVSFQKWMFVGYHIPRLLSYYILSFIFIFIYIQKNKLSPVKIFNLKPKINKVYVYLLCLLGVILIHCLYYTVIIPIYSLLIKPYNVTTQYGTDRFYLKKLETFSELVLKFLKY